MPKRTYNKTITKSGCLHSLSPHRGGVDSQWSQDHKTLRGLCGGVNKMKKSIILFAFIFLPFFVSAQVFEKDLYFGFQGDSDVQKLQEFLKDQGYYSGPITGNFFSLTISAVKKFQGEQGITPVSGYFGPKTRTKVNKLLTSEGISAGGSVNKSEVTIPIPPTPTKSTTNDVVISLLAQIQLLQQQLNALQQQQAAQTQQITQPSVPLPAPTPSPTNTTGTLDFEQVSPLTVILESTETKISWRSQNVTNCVASGDWEGVKPANGSITGFSYRNYGNGAERTYTYTLICGTTDGFSISKTLTVKVVSDTPVITLKYQGSPGSRSDVRLTTGGVVDYSLLVDPDSATSKIALYSFVVDPNSAVQFTWTAMVKSERALQCTANDEKVSPNDNKEIIATQPFMFRFKCVSNTGIQVEKSVYINFPGVLTVRADASQPFTQLVNKSQQGINVPFQCSASYEDITSAKLKFQLSPNASAIVKNAVDNTISTDCAGSVSANGGRVFHVTLWLGDLNNIPISGITFQLTNIYARYIRKDSTEVITTTPGPNNTQATSTVVLIRE